MVTALRVLVAKHQKQEEEYEPRATFPERQSQRPLGPIHVPYLLTQMGGHSCGPELYIHRHAGRERLPRAGGVRDTSRDLSAYLIFPDPPATPKRLGQTVRNGCPPPPSCFPGACGLQEGDQSLGGGG